MLSGVIPHELLVARIDDTFIYCGGGWKFLRTLGTEVDEDLGWDGVTVTGSYLVAK